MQIIKTLALVTLLSIMGGCNSPSDQHEKQTDLDSAIIADSLKKVNDQRIIDSVNRVTREQQIIADSITNQILNQ